MSVYIELVSWLNIFDLFENFKKYKQLKKVFFSNF